MDIQQSPGQYHLTHGDWRLTFERTADRWRHRLLVQKAGTWLEFWASREGASDQDWPPSPAFQDLHLQPIDDDCIEVQLVGQAGKKHYSGVVRWELSQQQLFWDLAVHLPGVPEQPIGSHYRLQSSVVGESFEVEEIPGQPPLEVTQTSLPDCELSLGCADWSKSRLVRGRLTFRWQYSFRLTTET